MNSPAKSAKKRSRPWRRVLVWLLLAVVAALIVINLLPQPVTVEVARVTRGPLAVSVFEEGQTRVRHRFTISPPIVGFLNRIELRAGDPIVAGQTVLATIRAETASLLDPRARAQAEARLQAATATADLRRAELERARSVLDLAEKEAARAEILLKTNAISRREWESATSQVQVRGREVTAAEFALRVAEFEIDQARSALLQADSPADDQKPVTILAPVTGVVLQVLEESARPVTPGLPLMEVGDPRDLEAEIELLSSDAVAVQPGAEVSIENWGGNAPLRGRVSMVELGGFTKISALGVEEQRVRVRVEFLNLPDNILLGDRYRVEARIITWQNDDVAQIPTGALFRRGNQWMVFTLKDGRAHAQPVTLGHQNPTAAELLSGLDPQDEIILYPPDSLTDGTRVKAN
jgi:HlyD family secretion protein